MQAFAFFTYLFHANGNKLEHPRTWAWYANWKYIVIKF